MISGNRRPSGLLLPCLCERDGSYMLLGKSDNTSEPVPKRDLASCTLTYSAAEVTPGDDDLVDSAVAQIVGAA